MTDPQDRTFHATSHTYEEMADFFLSTATGAASAHMAGLDRDGLIARLKARFPNEAEASAHFEALKKHALSLFPPKP